MPRQSANRRAFVPFALVALACAALGGVFLAKPLAAWLGLATQVSQAFTVAPSFAIETAEGRPLTLKSFRGKPVLLNVWATWCPPCRKEMPSLDRLQALKGGAGFEVLALSIDRGGAEQVRPFFEEFGIRQLTMYLDRSATAMRTLAILGLPTTLLIGADGRELARWVGPKEWDSPETIAEIDKLLGAAGKD